MKKMIFLVTLFVALLTKTNVAQVIISPYIVYMDEQNKFGSMIVQNESLEPYEITISFIFGFPISDSVGNRTMEYQQNPSDEMPSINDWIRAFPKKFVLKPKERQTIRLMIRPPANLEDGTYWTRIVTSSAPANNKTDTSASGVSAKLKFVLNQVTTAIYRKNEAVVNLQIENPQLMLDSTNTYQLLYNIEREGNSPFFGYLDCKIFDAQNNIILNERDYSSIYFNLIRNYPLKRESFPPGKYKAILEIEYNEKDDIPESSLPPKQNISNSFEFTIP